MNMSDYERLRGKELEAELARERRLRAPARRLGVMPSPRVIVWWATSGVVGLALVLAGSVVGIGALLVAGVVILAATLVLIGTALIAASVTDIRRRRRLLVWPGRRQGLSESSPRPGKRANVTKRPGTPSRWNRLEGMPLAYAADAQVDQRLLFILARTAPHAVQATNGCRLGRRDEPVMGVHVVRLGGD
jgi:hypothetical protein